MPRYIALVFFSAVTLFSCSRQQSWNKTLTGLPYRITTPGHGPRARMGSTVKCTYTRRIRDSITFTNEHQMPEYFLLVPGVLQPYTISEALLFAAQDGAVVEISQTADSMLAKGTFTKLRPGQKLSDRWITRIHVEKVFTPDPIHPLRNDSLLSADRKKTIAFFQSK